MKNRELSAIPITATERLVISVGEHRGAPLFDLRRQTRTGGRWFPTRDGFSVAEDTLHQLRDAIDQALDADFHASIAAAARSEGFVP